MSRVRLVCTLLLGLSVGTWANGCEPGQPDADSVPLALSGLEPVGDGGDFLVTPTFAASGRIAAAGLGGQGRIEIDPATGRVLVRDGTRPSPVGDEDGFVNLFDDGQRRVRWAPYWGDVQVRRGTATTVLARQDAWGVRVSSGGERVAWCTGHLPVARLHVATADGQHLFEGPGAQPAWFPDGVRLTFVVPNSAPDATGRPVLAGARLAALDVESGRVTSLATPGIALPMQPAVSPDGTRLVLSDWATGRLLLGRLAEPGGAY